MSITKDLYVKYDEDGSTDDYTSEARDFLRDSFQLSHLQGADNGIYLGLYKPFYQVYVELVSAIVEAVELDIEYYNGTSWVSFPFQDDTKNLKRSGFVKWDREFSDWAKFDLDGDELYYVRIKANADYDAEFNGINLVFSDDEDLKTVERNISRQLASGDNSFIAYHVGARNEIIQRLKNSGNIKRKTQQEKVQQIQKWDILEVGDIREASKFLTLARIMFDVSEQSDDKYWQRYNEYMDMFGSSFNLYLQRIDFDDDGVSDTYENNNFRTLEMVKS